MTTLRLILGDQLSHSLSSLRDIRRSDTVLMCEVMEEASYVPHHPKKIAFLFSAMRHFAKELEKRGATMRYVTLDDPDNTGSFDGEVMRAVADCGAKTLIVTEPGEWRVLEKFHAWRDLLDIPVEIREDDRFLCSLSEFNHWARGRKQFRMEYFYREMRRAHDILMEKGDKPTGGKWNYDKENRNPPTKGLRSPPRVSYKKDKITLEVLSLVKARFPHHYGTLEPFHFAVDRTQALKEAKHFIDILLPSFGQYQDSMVRGEAYLYHSLLSAYMNAGILLPLELCRMAEAAYREDKAPLNAVEGYIRQILGWREFMRGIYWHHMPAYAALNTLEAARPLPEFYWSGDTRMRCVKEAVAQTMEHAYSHHIQRLMVTGNFALIAGLNPEKVCAWYLTVYADAYEWVELPNTLGMALHGDGGICASKPYAASGKYIDRMSDFCSGCFYDPAETLGEEACPFNSLYWDFMARHEPRFRRYQRLPYIYATWQKMGEEKQGAIRRKAAAVLESMAKGTL